MQENKIISIPFFIPALVISLGLILASSVGAYAFYKSRTLDNTLSVTGSTKTRVVSDSAKWTFNIYRRVYEQSIPTGYSSLAKDLAQVNAFLNQNGIKENQITVNPIYMEEVWREPSYQGPREVILRQVIMVDSEDVKGITAVAKSTETLARSGILISTQSPQYFYSKLSELRVSLLSDAIKDAKSRAEQIAKSSGQSIGSLKSASSGVVQVLAPNSIEVTDYGTYDTSTIDKDVMVTVRGVFFVK